MKIVTWNCNEALRRKFRHLAQFEADIIVAQECENPATTNDSPYREWAKKFFWVGENRSKGLGIFFNDNLKIELLDWETVHGDRPPENERLKYFIACTVSDDITFLGTWCYGTNLSGFQYIGQLWQYLQKHKMKLKRTIIAGDFNSNVIWDKKYRCWNHSDVVRELSELKIESLYHRYFKEEQGKESIPTFFLQRRRDKPYHIDYIFASVELINSMKRMEIGCIDNWMEISDHMPVFCEL